MRVAGVRAPPPTAGAIDFRQPQQPTPRRSGAAWFVRHAGLMCTVDLLLINGCINLIGLVPPHFVRIFVKVVCRKRRNEPSSETRTRGETHNSAAFCRRTPRSTLQSPSPNLSSSPAGVVCPAALWVLSWSSVSALSASGCRRCCCLKKLHPQNSARTLCLDLRKYRNLSDLPRSEDWASQTHRRWCCFSPW